MKINLEFRIFDRGGQKFGLNMIQ